MTILLSAALAIFRLGGFFVEPLLENHEIHAVSGEPARVTATAAAGRPIATVTWNIERGLEFDAIASMLEGLDADVVLLQEVDRFCSRSGNRDVARELAVRLRMNWVSAGEFQEIGEGRRGTACVSGQAILSRLTIEDAAVVRFSDQASLKWRINPLQPRRGARIALKARTAGALVYSVHLESGAGEVRRGNQVADIVADARDERRPVVIAGDFNNEGGPASAMFAGLAAAGFSNTMPDESIARNVARRPIDWIFTRGLRGVAAAIPASGASDHDPVSATLRARMR